LFGALGEIFGGGTLFTQLGRAPQTVAFILLLVTAGSIIPIAKVSAWYPHDTALVAVAVLRTAKSQLPAE
jgi:hypothetical protein